MFEWFKNLLGDRDLFEGKPEKKRRAMDVLGEETRKEKKKKAEIRSEIGYRGFFERKVDVLENVDNWDEEVRRKLAHPDVFRLTGPQLKQVLKEKGYKWANAEIRMDFVNEHYNLFENELKGVYGPNTSPSALVERFGEETLREKIADAFQKDVELGEVSNYRLVRYFDASDKDNDDRLEDFKPDSEETEEAV